MAKELPFFKFEPAQWENGNIQLCSFELQGVFVSVCSMYWQRLGDLPYKLAVQKICKGNATALDSLIEEDVIKLIDGHLCIDFLNEQLSEFENTSKVNSENARSGWQKRKKNATPMPPHSDPNAIRGEERREDDIKPFDLLNFYPDGQTAFDDIKQDELLIERLVRIVQQAGFKGCDAVKVTLAVRKFITVESAKEEFSIKPKSEVKKHLVNWINKNAKNIEEYAGVSR